MGLTIKIGLIGLAINIDLRGFVGYLILKLS